MSRLTSEWLTSEWCQANGRLTVLFNDVNVLTASMVGAIEPEALRTLSVRSDFGERHHADRSASYE
jgi:hypothetical protein